MYSREIKEVPEILPNGCYLENMFAMQGKLLEHYTKLEKLPNYPISIHSKENQALLKEFSDRVIEELAEAYEYALMLHQEFDPQKVYNFEAQPREYINSIANSVFNFNEELADAIHFMLELLTYTNIGPTELMLFTEDICRKCSLQLTSVNQHDILENCMGLGFCLINKSDTNIEQGTMNYFNLLDLLNLVHENAHQHSPALQRYSVKHIEDLSKPLWDITYSMKMANNCLKNRAWKVDQQLSDEKKYQLLLMESFVKMAGLFKLLGLTSYNVYYIYFLKNRVNQFRIESGY